MTVLAIFGEKEASSALVTAALNDTLEAHLVDTPDEEFRLFVGIPKTMPIYSGILAWAVRSSVPVDVYLPFDAKVLRNIYAAQLDVHWHRHEDYMMELVRALDTQPNVKIYALLGDMGAQEPSVAVRRALVRALDNGVEVRDLAEAGLTVVGVADNPIRQGSTTMADDLMTLEAAGTAADEEGDAESIEALTTFAAEHGIDPDDYPTWSDLAAALDPLLAAEPEEAPATSNGALTEDDLEGKSVPELRNLAKQLGVEGWETNRSAKLITGILAAQGSGAASKRAKSEDNGELTAELVGSIGISAEALARGLRAFADALDS